MWGNTEEFDPDNTMWRNAYNAQGGEGDYDTFLHVDSAYATSAMYLLDGQEQANEWCRVLYNQNGLADLGVDAVCCQAFYIEHTDIENRMTFGFMTTAPTVLEDYGVEVEYVQQD